MIAIATIDIGNGFSITEDYITPNPYSRPRTKLKKVQKIAVHYVGNPNSTAKNNRDYFDSLAKTNSTYVSSHFVVGLKGEILQCIPTDEIAYCTSDANSYSVSIEACHPDLTGKFTDFTEKALIQLTAHLLRQFGLKGSSDVIRHHDVTGKQCPLYYVTNPDAYQFFLSAVQETMDQLSGGEIKSDDVELKYFKINKTFNNGNWNREQIGAYRYPDELNEAIRDYEAKRLSSDYFIFDPFGDVVYPKLDSCEGESDVKIKMLEERLAECERRLKDSEEGRQSLQKELGKIKEAFSKDKQKLLDYLREWEI